jgi:hypothetical protein
MNADSALGFGAGYSPSPSVPGWDGPLPLLQLWLGGEEVGELAKRIVIVLALCLLALFIVHRVVRITAEALRVKIQEELPVGSSADKVLGFLDSLKTEHSEVFSSEDDSDFRGPTRMITAAIRGFRRGNLLADGVFMKFKLDERDRLRDFRVKYVLTGP